MKRGYAVAVPLPIWQDPQGSLLLHVASDQAEVEFPCWTDAAEEADFTGAIVFEGVWATRTVGTEFSPFQVEPHNFHSSILRVEESAWIEELAAARKATYTDWPRADAANYSHYVVVGHSEYVEVVARSWRVEQRQIASDSARAVSA